MKKPVYKWCIGVCHTNISMLIQMSIVIVSFTLNVSLCQHKLAGFFTYNFTSTHLQTVTCILNWSLLWSSPMVMNFG